MALLSPISWRRRRFCFPFTTHFGYRGRGILRFVAGMKHYSKPSRLPLRGLFVFFIWSLIVFFFWLSLFQLAQLVRQRQNSWLLLDYEQDWRTWSPPLVVSSSRDAVIRHLWPAFMTNRILPPHSSMLLFIGASSPLPSLATITAPESLHERGQLSALLTTILHGFINRVVWIYPYWQHSLFRHFHTVVQYEVGLTRIAMHNRMVAPNRAADLFDQPNQTGSDDRPTWPATLTTICLCVATEPVCIIPLINPANFVIPTQLCAKNSTFIFEKLIDLVAETHLSEPSYANPLEATHSSNQVPLATWKRSHTQQNVKRVPWLDNPIDASVPLPHTLLIDLDYFGFPTGPDPHGLIIVDYEQSAVQVEKLEVVDGLRLARDNLTFLGLTDSVDVDIALTKELTFCLTEMYASLSITSRPNMERLMEAQRAFDRLLLWLPASGCYSSSGLQCSFSPSAAISGYLNNTVVGRHREEDSRTLLRTISLDQLGLCNPEWEYYVLEQIINTQPKISIAIAPLHRLARLLCSLAANRLHQVARLTICSSASDKQSTAIKLCARQSNHPIPSKPQITALMHRLQLIFEHAPRPRLVALIRETTSNLDPSLGDKVKSELFKLLSESFKAQLNYAPDDEFPITKTPK